MSRDPRPDFVNTRLVRLVRRGPTYLGAAISSYWRAVLARVAIAVVYCAASLPLAGVEAHGVARVATCDGSSPVCLLARHDVALSAHAERSVEALLGGGKKPAAKEEE